MKAQIPAVITTYFEASNANDIEALVACFSPDAQVTDENQIHRGAAEIKAWGENVRKKFLFKTDILKATERDSGAVVTAKLSGNFPGSPVELEFTFILDHNKICSLVID